MSGEPIAASNTRSRVARSRGRAATWKYRPLDVPPRIRVQGMAVSIGAYSAKLFAGQLVTVSKTALREFLAHRVDVESQLAGLESRAYLCFLGLALSRLAQRLSRIAARYYAHAVVVGHYHIARA